MVLIILLTVYEKMFPALVENIVGFEQTGYLCSK
jgi:hypothetical protein